MNRYALIIKTVGYDNVAAYLPSNYKVIHEEAAILEDPYARDHWRHVVIQGEDNAGWTLDGYVIPRLASGGIPAHEIDLSHPIMKRVPHEQTS